MEDRHAMELDQTSTPDAIMRVAATHLADRFTSVDREHIEATVRRHVEARCAHARVTNFVGILAERGARAELERE